jgi:hypothetical protein
MAAIKLVRLGVSVLCDCIIKVSTKLLKKKEPRASFGTDILGIQRPSSNECA